MGRGGGSWPLVIVGNKPLCSNWNKVGILKTGPFGRIALS